MFLNFLDINLVENILWFLGGVGLTVISFSLSKRSKKEPLPKESVPTNLGIREGVDINEIVDTLENALDKDYMERVRMRVLLKCPHWSQNDYDWNLFELKRYFVLVSIFKNVPMFSEDVDDIWHEMIMFTKDYEKFSNNFLGETIHHFPNMSDKSQPEQRALFDLVYTYLFNVHKNSVLLWRDFFNYPLSKEMIEDFLNEEINYLKETYFRSFDMSSELVEEFIYYLKNQLQNSNEKKEEKRTFGTVTQTGDLTLLSIAMIYFSVSNPDNFSTEMNSLKGIDTTSSASGCSSCGSDSSCSGCGS